MTPKITIQQFCIVPQLQMIDTLMFKGFTKLCETQKHNQRIELVQ